MSQSEIKRLLIQKDSSISVTSEVAVTEKEIAEQREIIVQRLHASYLILNDEMKEFQQQWDNNPYEAFAISVREGWNAAGHQWIDDQKALFDAKLWTDLGGKVKSAAGESYDRIANYNRRQFEFLKRELNKHVTDPDETLHNWAWWQATIDDSVREYVNEKSEQINKAYDTIKDGVGSILETTEKARKIYQHRAAILNLPELIAIGAPGPIQNFVDTVLMDIDPELSKAIRNDPNFAVVLEVIADHESALGYLAYIGLMFESIPPNFYAFVAGKGAGYLMIEVAMLAVTALLSAGTAVAARIGMLVARFTSVGVKASGASRRIRNVEAAIRSFLHMVEDFSRAANDFHLLGEKLVLARSRGLVLIGKTRTTLTAKREMIKRDKKCRLCGSNKHTTPRIRRGTVQYE